MGCAAPGTEARPIDNARWQHWTTQNSGLPSNRITALYVSKTGDLWIDTDRGLVRFNGTIWQTVSLPDSTDVTAIFEDSRGYMWIGATDGALRLDGERWAPILPNSEITAFDEGPAGIVWIGTENGLIRYDSVTGQQAIFNAENSGLRTNRVNDLHVDRKGNLWVSTYLWESRTRSPLLAILPSVGFFGGLVQRHLWCNQGEKTLE